MLFYVKKSLWLDLTVTLFLGGVGWLGIQYFSLPSVLLITPTAIFQGLASFLLITAWTFLVQRGYALIKGNDYAKALTEALAKEYHDASLLKALAAGVTAAFGEELFFRGFIQQKWGLIAACATFGIAHYGKKDIRIISHWSFIHGLLFGLSFKVTGNLLVPFLAHGLFDLGGVIYSGK
ncbi:MAG TPA: CPBP family intramembrane glutamic endopeptidase [Candidatus Binatia bacterium]